MSNVLKIKYFFWLCMTLSLSLEIYCAETKNNTQLGKLIRYRTFHWSYDYKETDFNPYRGDYWSPRNAVCGYGNKGGGILGFALYLSEENCDEGLMSKILSSPLSLKSNDGHLIHYLYSPDISFPEMESSNFGYREKDYCLKLTFSPSPVISPDTPPYHFSPEIDSDLSVQINRIVRSVKFEPTSIEPKQIESIRLFSHKDTPLELQVSHLKADSQSFIDSLILILNQINAKRKQAVKLRIINLPTKNKSPYSGKNIIEAEKILEQDADYDSPWLGYTYKTGLVKLIGSEDEKFLIFDTNIEGQNRDIPILLSKIWKNSLVLNIFNEPTNANGSWAMDLTPNNILYMSDTSSPNHQEFWQNKGYSGKFLTVNSSWLRTKRIDSQFTTVIRPDAPCGFAILKADPNLALETLLKTSRYNLDNFLMAFKNKKMFKTLLYLQAFLHQSTIKDKAIIRHNHIISKIINQNVEKLKNKIIEQTPACQNIEVVSLPTLFECDESNSIPEDCRNLLPNSLHMIVLDQDLILSDPLYPPFKKIIEEKLKSIKQVPYFIDDSLYHEYGGDVHLGSNELRF